MFGKSARNCIVLLALLILLPLVKGCSEQETTPPPDTVTSPREKIHLGLIPEQDLFSQKERYNELAGYLSEKAGVDVELKILSRYGNIIDNFIAGDLDAAFFGSFTGALAISKLGVVPLARPEWLDGTSTYHGMIFVRKDSSINDAADMKGKRFAFVDMATTAGWLLPLHYFADIGIRDFENWFSETYFTGTHEDAILDVLDGTADIGAAKNTVYYRLAQKNPRILDELRILTISPEVPANALAVRKDLDSSLAVKLKNTLLQMDQNDKGRKVLQAFGARKFIETTTKDYTPVFDYANEIRLDLQRYQYRNN